MVTPWYGIPLGARWTVLHLEVLDGLYKGSIYVLICMHPLEIHSNLQLRHRVFHQIQALQKVLEPAHCGHWHGNGQLRRLRGNDGFKESVQEALLETLLEFVQSVLAVLEPDRSPSTLPHERRQLAPQLPEPLLVVVRVGSSCSRHRDVKLV